MNKHFFLPTAVFLALIVVTSGCGTSGQTTNSSAPGGLPTSLPAITQPSTASTTKLLSTSFGREGGNIRPYSIVIDEKGTITSDYPSDCIKKGSALSAPELKTVLDKATTDAFTQLPAQIGSHLPMPDRASLFVEVTTSQGTKKVDLASGTNTTFTDLFDYLTSAATKPSCRI